MSVQTTYELVQGAAYPGLLYDINNANVISKSVETVAGIGFGLAVSRGTNKETQVVLGGSEFLGIGIRDLAREGALNSGDILYKQFDTAGVMTSGSIYATCTDGCTAGDPVKYVIATGILTAGAAGAGEIGLDDGVWDTTTVAGSIGVIRLEGSNFTVGA